jgi:hypothetical protein
MAGNLRRNHNRPNPKPARRRPLAVGKRENGRGQVRTSLWRYLLATAVSQ